MVPILPILTSIFTNKWVLIGIASAGLFFYVQHLRSANEELRNDKAALEVSVETQKETIKQILEDHKDITEAKTKIQEKVAKLEESSRKLEETLYRERRRKKSLEELAIKRASLIQKLINKATQKQFDCFELISQGKECS